MIDFSKTTKIQLDCIEIKDPEVTAIADALSQKIIFKLFHLKGILSNTSQEKPQNYDNIIKVFLTAVFHDETGQCEMTLLDQLWIP